MRKSVMIVIGLIGLSLLFLTARAGLDVLRTEWKLPRAIEENQGLVRLVLITQELDTPFWDKVGASALQEAKRQGASLEIWGSYGNNSDDFLKKMEIAIDSKVDGLIVQGLDSSDFKQLTKVKAASLGIPLITVANDVPAAESLRKTYVGSDSVKAGEMIAESLIRDLNGAGQIVVFGRAVQAAQQKLRMRGIEKKIADHSGLNVIYIESDEARDQVIAKTRDAMNRYPKAKAYVALDANLVGAMVQEIERRKKIEPYYIYSFDDAIESFGLLKQGKLDGVLEQAPDQMGKISVQLMMKWLNGDQLPLDRDGYLTDLRMLRTEDVR